jgi:hypothetical protein
MTHNAGFEKGDKVLYNDEVRVVWGKATEEDKVLLTGGQVVFAKDVVGLLPEPDEIWETRQVMLAQGREIKALKELVKDLDAQINGLTKRYEKHDHFKSQYSSFTSGPVVGVMLDDGSE